MTTHLPAIRRPHRGGKARGGIPEALAPTHTAPIGNQGLQQLLNHGSVGKLQVGASNDPAERRADHLASHVTGTAPQPASPQAQRAAGQSGQPAMPAPASVDHTVARPGQPLEAAQRQAMEQRFGVDFSAVRVHTDSQAQQSAHELGARAYTAGPHIVFGSGQYAPNTPQGQHLIAHELAHVVQQSHSGDATVRRSIQPEDVAIEMFSRTFELAGPFSSAGVSAAKGASVTVLNWVNADTTALVLAPVTVGSLALTMPVLVPKTLLRPVRPASTLDPYSAGIDAQAKVVEKNEADLVGKTGAEKARLEALLDTRRGLLNRELIQETMFNRFDPVIESEVAAANASHGFTGAAALDANLVKAMIFQESEMGTAGTHMSMPATNPIKTRFNLGQVIDSSAMALFTMMEREQPAWITAFSLGNLRSDLAAAQADKQRLEAKLLKKGALNAADAAQLATLKAQSQQNWEAFIWGYVAPGQTSGFAAAVSGFFAAASPARNMDYTFWIHMLVFWLFEKKRPTRTWAQTIMAYNGSGKRAQHYRDAVVGRAADASAAKAGGTAFIPTR